MQVKHAAIKTHTQTRGQYANANSKIQLKNGQNIKHTRRKRANTKHRKRETAKHETEIVETLHFNNLRSGCLGKPIDCSSNCSCYDQAVLRDSISKIPFDGWFSSHGCFREEFHFLCQWTLYSKVGR